MIELIASRCFSKTGKQLISNNRVRLEGGCPLVLENELIVVTEGDWSIYAQNESILCSSLDHPSALLVFLSLCFTPEENGQTVAISTTDIEGISFSIDVMKEFISKDTQFSFFLNSIAHPHMRKMLVSLLMSGVDLNGVVDMFHKKKNVILKPGENLNLSSCPAFVHYGLIMEGPTGFITATRRWGILNGVNARSISSLTYFEAPLNDDFKFYGDEEFEGLLDGASLVSYEELLELRKDKLLKVFPPRNLLQHDQTDCAAGCVSYIASSYGLRDDISFWRDLIGVDQNGVSFEQLVNSLNGISFFAHLFQVEDYKLLDREMLPAIILVDGHYRVLTQIQGDRYSMFDPLLGELKGYLKDLNTGLSPLLVLTPGSDLPSKSLQKYAYYFSILRERKGALIGLYLLSLLGVFVSVLPAKILQYLFDNVLAVKDFSNFSLIIFGLVCAHFSICTYQYFRSYCLVSAKADFESLLVERFLISVFNKKFSFFGTRSIGDFTSRVHEIGKIKEILFSRIVGTGIDIVYIAGYFIFLASYSLKLAIFTLGASIVLPFISLPFSSSLKNSFVELFHLKAVRDDLLASSIQSVGTIKTLGLEKWMLNNAGDLLLKYSSATKKFSKKIMLIEKITELTSSLILVGAIWFAVSHFTEIGATEGALIAIMTMVSSLIQPFHNLGGIYTDWLELKAGFDRLNDVILSKESAALEYSFEKSEIVEQAFGVKVQNLNFSYFKFGNKILDSIDLQIGAGETLGIVGLSGSGKSTLLNIIAGLLEPSEGGIAYLNLQGEKLSGESVKSRCAIFNRDVHLFNGTIGENITFSESTEVDHDRLETAIALSGLDSVLSLKPLGLNHRIGFNDTGFSSGQRQRIAIARLFYHKPSIVLLDEATSSLDVLSEQQILRNLKLHLPTSTLVIVSHRESGLVTCDRALIMKNGRFIYEGEPVHVFKTLINV